VKLLPTNLAAIGNLAASESTKFSMNCIKLELDDTTYRAIATDSKMIGIVEGCYVGDDKEYPEIPAMTNAPNGSSAALVPLKFWQDTMKAAAKLTRRYGRGNGKPILASVAVKTSETEITLGCTDLDSSPVSSSRHIEGRYPPYKEVLPKNNALVEFFIDPDAMIKMLQTAKQYASEDCRYVRVRLHAKNLAFSEYMQKQADELETAKAEWQAHIDNPELPAPKVVEHKPFQIESPIYVESSNLQTAQIFTGLIMPLSGGGVPMPEWRKAKDSMPKHEVPANRLKDVPEDDSPATESDLNPEAPGEPLTGSYTVTAPTEGESVCV
jgi:hypothetical protein